VDQPWSEDLADNIDTPRATKMPQWAEHDLGRECLRGVAEVMNGRRGSREWLSNDPVAMHHW